jgi:hypothetical protein
MTGKDLIIYILENNLENEEMFKDGKLMGFMSADEAAIKFNVGFYTIHYWIFNDMIPHIELGTKFYIPVNAKRPGSE